MSSSVISALVIGGAGYISAHLVSQLVGTGRRVTILGRSAVPTHGLPAGAAYVVGDFSQRELVRDLPFLKRNQFF